MQKKLGTSFPGKVWNILASQVDSEAILAHTVSTTLPIYWWNLFTAYGKLAYTKWWEHTRSHYSEGTDSYTEQLDFNIFTYFQRPIHDLQQYSLGMPLCITKDFKLLYSKSGTCMHTCSWPFLAFLRKSVSCRQTSLSAHTLFPSMPTCQHWTSHCLQIYS